MTPKLEAVRDRVVIVDDSRTNQGLLEDILRTRLCYEVVGVAEDASSAMSMIRRLQPDLVTIDLALPYVEGRKLLIELQDQPHICKVVISSTIGDNVVVQASLARLGAAACIAKQTMVQDPDVFCRALSSVVRARAIPLLASVAKAIAPVSVPAYPVPADERARLAALKMLNLANSDAEYRLDLLTEHLVRTTRFSASVMTFIDRDVQWIKSASGMERGSTARAQAICNHTICGDDPFIVQDTLADVRFSRLDDVQGGAMIRSYVGHPIIGPSGTRLGAICLIDPHPRRVSLKELASLASIARIAAQWIAARSGGIRQAA